MVIWLEMSCKEKFLVVGWLMGGKGIIVIDLVNNGVWIWV